MVGIGYFYMYLNPERETLHGKLSGTKVVLVPLMEKSELISLARRSKNIPSNRQNRIGPVQPRRIKLVHKAYRA